MKDAKVEVKTVAVTGFSRQEGTYNVLVTLSVNSDLGEVAIQIPVQNRRGLDGAVDVALTTLAEWGIAAQRGAMDLQARIPRSR